jgi:hypothetical protein
MIRWYADYARYAWRWLGLVSVEVFGRRDLRTTPVGREPAAWRRG